MPSAPAIPVIIDRHAEDAAFLWLLRDAAIKAPNYSLDDLTELDNRFDAHLDGLRVAGDTAWAVCKSALEIGEPGEVFAAAFLALESGDGKKIDSVIGAAQGSPENLRALVSALGWLDFRKVEGLANSFCNANHALYNYLGIAAHALHRVDPGQALERGLASDNGLLRARSLKAVGELNREDLLPALQEQWQADDEACRFWATWSAVVTGDQTAGPMLKTFVRPDSPFAEHAVKLAVRCMDSELARNWLAGLAQEEETRRYALLGAGHTGDPLYMPSLFNQMAVPAFARVAGEAFSLIMGADLAYLDLDADWPEGFQAGPTEDPEDESVELDQDEDLPWPNPVAIDQWWTDNEHRFRVGERYLCGEPISRQQCLSVLQGGYQRQREAAALELALMGEGGTLYEIRSPGFRQKRGLAGSGTGA